MCDATLVTICEFENSQLIASYTKVIRIEGEIVGRNSENIVKRIMLRNYGSPIFNS